MTTKQTISNADDLIDSRDVIERIEELEEMLPADASEVMPGTGEELQNIREELATLKALEEQASDYAPDWEYGEILIRDSYFQDYAEQLAEDIGAIDTTKNYGWPLNCIDWEQAARDLQMDYTAVDFDGVTYWVR